MIEKIKEEFRNNPIQVGEAFTKNGHKKQDIKSISYSNAGNCPIEFSTETARDKALNEDYSTLSNTGNITKLLFTDQNNFVLIKGILQRQCIYGTTD